MQLELREPSFMWHLIENTARLCVIMAAVIVFFQWMTGLYYVIICQTIGFWAGLCHYTACVHIGHVWVFELSLWVTKRSSADSDIWLFAAGIIAQICIIAHLGLKSGIRILSKQQPLTLPPWDSVHRVEAGVGLLCQWIQWIFFTPVYFSFSNWSCDIVTISSVDLPLNRSRFCPEYFQSL